MKKLGSIKCEHLSLLPFWAFRAAPSKKEVPLSSPDHHWRINSTVGLRCSLSSASRAQMRECQIKILTSFPHPLTCCLWVRCPSSLPLSRCSIRFGEFRTPKHFLFSHSTQAPDVRELGSWYFLLLSLEQVCQTQEWNQSAQVLLMAYWLLEIVELVVSMLSYNRLLLYLLFETEVALSYISRGQYTVI